MEDGRGRRANSKHWFTTSFLQSLPQLITAISLPKNVSIGTFFCTKGAQIAASLLNIITIMYKLSAFMVLFVQLSDAEFYTHSSFIHATVFHSAHHPDELSEKLLCV